MAQPPIPKPPRRTPQWYARAALVLVGVVGVVWLARSQVRATLDAAPPTSTPTPTTTQPPPEPGPAHRIRLVSQWAWDKDAVVVLTRNTESHQPVLDRVRKIADVDHPSDTAYRSSVEVRTRFIDRYEPLAAKTPDMQEFNARIYVQLDDPDQVAELERTLCPGGRCTAGVKTVTDLREATGKLLGPFWRDQADATVLIPWTRGFEDAARIFQDRLERLPGVEWVRYVSPEEALDHLAPAVRECIQSKPDLYRWPVVMPASIMVRLHDPGQTGRLADRLCPPGGTARCPWEPLVIKHPRQG